MTTCTAGVSASIDVFCIEPDDEPNQNETTVDALATTAPIRSEMLDPSWYLYAIIKAAKNAREFSTLTTMAPISRTRCICATSDAS